jgi:hypothetical protein
VRPFSGAFIETPNRFGRRSFAIKISGAVEKVGIRPLEVTADVEVSASLARQEALAERR